ncbi:MAG: protein translocase subunit SecF [Candidatus Marinimicrobia bacterium]|nr:protein translocase subunit SecF [Candidatus Neomarinimicrobiota bacterium]
MELFRDTKIDFIGKRKIGMKFSLTLIIVGILSLIVHGGPRLGIDFLGGTLVQMKFEEPVSSVDVRSAVSEAGYEGAVIQQFGDDREVLIRILEAEGSGEDAKIISEALGNYFSGNAYEIRKVEKVGPKIGAELRGNAVLAIFVALIGIVIYITFRFEFKFAIGALIALAHDVIITLGIFSVLDIEINLAVIAAFLTIVGYSLNDTIVIYDRIRENIKSMRHDSYETIVNTSINNSLARTVVTSFTTFMVVFILYTMGGEVISGFSFAMMIGVVIGTYSSIFIASPVLIEWQARDAAKKRATVAASGTR